MSQFESRPCFLQNPIQYYAWGGRGKDAYIPRLLGFEPVEGVPYAELWIGTHPKSPSNIVYNNQTIPLPDIIAKYPLEFLGERVAAKFSGQLPFLLKVLSAVEPLSIQVHPNKKQAEFLHCKDPINYPDGNHKPEIAIALDALTAMGGFRSAAELYETAREFPELYGPFGLIGGGSDQGIIDLRSAYSNIMTGACRVTEAVLAIADRLTYKLESDSPLSEEERLFLQLKAKYPGDDSGVFSLFFLKLQHLKKGQAIFIAPGVPHAYLGGTIIECMATSDNVVRAGLTEKYKDVRTLLDIVDYDAYLEIEDRNGQPEQIYQTPWEEFRVSRMEMGKNGQKILVAEDSPRILLDIKGDLVLEWEDRSEILSCDVKRGQAVIAPASLGKLAVYSKNEVEFYEVDVPA